MWFDLFNKCFETIGMHPFMLLQHNDIISNLDAKVLYELLQKYFSHLILGNYILIENNETNSIEANISNEIEDENNYFESNESSNNRSKQITNSISNENEINSHMNNEVIFIHIPQQEIKTKANFITLNNIERLIQYLYQIYPCDTYFFSLITSEYITIFSNNSLKELSDTPNTL